MAAQTHVENLDKLLAFQEARIAEVCTDMRFVFSNHLVEPRDTSPYVIPQLHSEFNEELQALKDEFLSERHTLIDQFQREVNDIKDIVFAMEVNHVN
jgi:hypothetical protein